MNQEAYLYAADEPSLVLQEHSWNKTKMKSD